MKFQLCPCVAMQNCFKAQFSVPKAVELIANNSRTIWQLVKKKILTFIQLNNFVIYNNRSNFTYPGKVQSLS